MMALQYSTQVRNNKMDAIVYGPASAAGSTVVPWVASTTYTIYSSWVTNGGNLYLCITGGAAAGSGGPSGTANNITDNVAHWTYIGPAGITSAPTVTLYNGTAPVNPGTALSGNTVLATGVIPAAWLNAASAGAKTLAGTWTLTGQAGAGAGTAATFFRVIDASANVVVQGTVTASGGGGDMTLNNNSIANTQTETVTSFTLTSGNA